MNDKVAEISRDNTLQRVIRDNALASLMVVLAVVTMINGIIIGTGVAAMINNTNRVEQLQRQYEINVAWQGQVLSAVRAAGIQVPDQPTNGE